MDSVASARNVAGVSQGVLILRQRTPASLPIHGEEKRMSRQWLLAAFLAAFGMLLALRRLAASKRGRPIVQPAGRELGVAR